MRHWNNKQIDDGSIHCLGNGKLVVYEQGPNIIQLFGPPYSSPSFMQLLINDDNEIEAILQRETGTAIWEHKICKEGQCIGEIVDCVDASHSCMIRKVRLMQPLCFKLSISEGINICNNAARFKQCEINMGLLATARAGIYIYGNYPSPQKLYTQIIGQGKISFFQKNHGNIWDIRCEAGESIMFFIGGPTYPECVTDTEGVLQAGSEEIFFYTRKWWRDFRAKRFDFEKKIPKGILHRELLLETIDEVAILIKVQQALEGGVLAGHNYHLGYIRDQYGVSRCLLKLGYFDDAKAILNFYWNIWEKSGFLHNAQAIGVDGIFHMHENDQVEITGYLVLQAFDYNALSEDETFLKEILPMLEWAWEAQKKHLINYMLPFNGDETYVAGGILPRCTLNDGSAEATLLFITGGERLLGWIAKNGIWDDEKMSENMKLFDVVKSHYRENFWQDGIIVTNNPSRAESSDLPGFRHGVCESCFSFGWIEKNGYDRYLCPECIGKADLMAVEKKQYHLQSVSLMPLYIGSSIFSRDEISNMVEEIVKQYKKTGILPSSPDGTIAVGYDYGLLLYTLTDLSHPMAGEIFEKMLSVIDSAGAWVEYYENGKPMGTRCRPWESGINLEAAIHYVLKN